MLHATVKEFKDQKESQKYQMRTHEERVLEARREDANKVREISKIIQNEQKSELEKNMQIFLHLNREERNLRKELVEKQQEVEFKEKYYRKVLIQEQHKVVQEKRDEMLNFINPFMQAKNLIEKQMRIGRKIKEVKVQREIKREKVARVKEQRETDYSKERTAVKTVLFDSQLN